MVGLRPIVFVPRTLVRTWGTRRFPRRIGVLFTLLLVFRLTLAAETPQSALFSALRATPGVGVVVAVKTGRQLAAVKTPEATQGAPGSLLKPLFLASALNHHELLPQTTVFCRRDLHVIAEDRDWNLACTHPQTNVAFSAQEALAYSCNRYFAALADRLSPADAAATLSHYGLPQTHPPQTREQKELLVLGLAGLTTSPSNIAAA